MFKSAAQVPDPGAPHPRPIPSLPTLTPPTPTPNPNQQELMRLNVFKGAASLVNSEDLVGRVKIPIHNLAEVG